MRLLGLTNWVALIFLGIAFLYFYGNPSSRPSSSMAENSSKSIYDFTVKVMKWVLFCFILFYFGFFHLCLAHFGICENWGKERREVN
jgi:hypothetical protein